MADTQSSNKECSHKEMAHTPHNPAIRKATKQFQTNKLDAAMED